MVQRNSKQMREKLALERREIYRLHPTPLNEKKNGKKYIENLIQTCRKSNGSKRQIL